MIPIIDSLAHPTLSGTWLQNKLCSTFENLVAELKSNGFSKAMAVGISGVEGYEHKAFIEQCSKHKELIPIAGFNSNCDDVQNEMCEIKKLGYVGIKIHPRFSSMDYANNQLSEIFKVAAENKMVVLYCTYAHCGPSKYPETDPFYALAKAINASPETKIILMHGGDVSLLKYAELVRFNNNLLLDLSFTLMKYKGSSIDNDLQFLFANFDRKITIGTDYPEYTHKQVRERFNHFTEGLTQEKIENIAYRNISCFLEALIIS